jgi:LEA14-like dessication related protein
MKRPLALAWLLTGICFVLAAVSLLSLNGCSTIASALNIVNPTYSLRNIRPHVAIALPLSASTIDFDMDLGVDNPNSVGLRLDQVAFDLLVNGNNILNTTSNQQVQIPSRGLGLVHLTSRVGYNNIRGIWNEVVDVIQGNRANYEVRGTASYDTPAGRLNFPVTVYASK